MKKFTSIALYFIMIAALLAGCRGKDPSETNSPTNGTVAATQAPTSVTNPTRPTSPAATNPTTGATDGNAGTMPGDDSRSGIMLPKAY